MYLCSCFLNCIQSSWLLQLFIHIRLLSLVLGADHHHVASCSHTSSLSALRVTCVCLLVAEKGWCYDGDWGDKVIKLLSKLSKNGDKVAWTYAIFLSLLQKLCCYILYCKLDLCSLTFRQVWNWVHICALLIFLNFLASLFGITLFFMFLLRKNLHWWKKRKTRKVVMD